MKKTLLTFTMAFVVTITSFAQSPEAFKYQAVARDLTGNILASQPVSFQISILQGSATGSSVYTETHTTTTNSFGLVNLEIGNGALVSGAFSTIDWGANSYFVQIEMDENGGTSYNMMGTSQLLSVPYALHSNVADSLTGGITYSETDPVFSSSVANGITATDTAKWNNDLTGNTTISYSKETNVSNAYIMMDTINIKAGKVVTIKGYVQTTGSMCTVYLHDLTNSQWVNNSYQVTTIYEEEGVGYSSFIGTNGALCPFSTTKKEFTTYFLPTSDFQLVIRAKELTATAGNGVGEATVIVIQ